MTAAKALELQGVTKRYGDHVAVLDLSFSVPRGAIYGLLGPNGAGKSTTLRMINHIVAPDEGRVSILETLRPGPDAARVIGYLPEERGLYPKMRVAEAIAFLGEIRGMGRSSAGREAQQWLERLDLGAWERHRVGELSRGMQQKVQFIAALVHDPEILILDEPWSGLDPLNARVLESIVRERAARGRTVIFSTHLLDQAERLCDHVCIIAEGCKRVEGPLDVIRQRASGSKRIRVLTTVDQDLTAVLGADLRREGSGGEWSVSGEGRTLWEVAALLQQAGIEIQRLEYALPTLSEIFFEQACPDGNPSLARGAG